MSGGDGLLHHLVGDRAATVVTKIDVVAHTTGKKNRLLRHIANLVAKRLLRVVLHIHAIHQHLTLAGVVKARDQVHHRALATASGADESDRFAALCREGDVLDDAVLRVWIAEADVFENNLASVALCAFCARAVVDGRLRREHLVDALGSNLRTRQEHEDHHQHHKAHDHLDRVLGKHHHIRKQRHLANHVRRIDQHRADPVDRQREAAHDQLDARHQKRQRALGKKLRAREIIVGKIELVLLIILRVVGTHHAQACEVFAGNAVEIVRQLLQLAKLRQRQHQCHQHNDEQHAHRSRRGHRPLPLLISDLADRPDSHDRRHDQHLQPQHDQHLHLGHIVGRAGDQARRGKMTDLLHRERLHLRKQQTAHIRAERRANARRADRRHHRRRQTPQRAGQHHPACREDLRHFAAWRLDQHRDLAHVIRHRQAQPDLHHHKRHRKCRQQPLLLRKFP